MIEISQYGNVHRLFGEGCSKKDIARVLDLDVKTVRKWLSREWKRQQRRHESKAEPFRAWLEGRGPEVGWNGAVLHREAALLGFDGCYLTLARYVAQLRPVRQDVEASTLRYETEPGQQSQVDWGEIAVWIAGRQERVHFFAMTLGFSRRLYARGYLNERLDSLLDGHARAFEHYGGRTRTILYDNPRTIVRDKDEATGRIEWNPRFKDAMDFYGVECRLCHYYRAQSKGKVESGVKYIKRNALVGKAFASLEELNEYLVQWCLTVADVRKHGTTGEPPAERFARQEATVMIATDTRPAPCQVVVVRRRVPRDCLVALESNRYPVWWQWTGCEVEVRRQVEEIMIHGPIQQALRYARLTGKHETAHWNGEPRGRPPRLEAGTELVGAPRFDPTILGEQGQVQIRGLSEYQDLLEVTP